MCPYPGSNAAFPRNCTKNKLLYSKRSHGKRHGKLLIADLKFLNKIGMFYQQISIS